MAKAFDADNHTTLFDKLELCDTGSTVLELEKDNVPNRAQTVKIMELPITTGLTIENSSREHLIL